MLCGCAPVASYRGPTPAPGAVTAFAGGTPPHVSRGSTDTAHHMLGALETPAGAESVVALVYGDNRPGARTRVHPVLWRAVRRMTLTSPYKLARGLLALPVFIVSAIVPTLDGPRDLLIPFTHVPTGGAEVRVLKSLSDQPSPDLVVSSGDLVTWGDRGKLWEIWAARHAALRSRTLYLAAPGNHERTFDSTARANWAAVMGPPAADQRLWYAFDVPEAGARFVFLDSNSLRDWHTGAAAALAEEQLAWADSVLATGPARRFIVLHHGLLSGGYYRHPWDSHRPGSVIAKRRDRLLEMCAARHVTAMFAGHEHMYQRVYVETPDGGFWHITTAGGGSPLYPFDPPIRDLELSKPLPPGMHVVTASVHTQQVYHFCRLVLPRAPDRPPSLEVMRVGAGGSATPIDRIDLAPFAPAAAAGAGASEAKESH